MTIRLEAYYPKSDRTEIYAPATMKEAIALGNRLKQLGCTVTIKEVRGR